MSACRGDSGGGFAMKRGDRWYLRGVVSFGISKKIYRDKVVVQTCDEKYPSLYADITSAMDWLVDTVRERTIYTPDDECDNDYINSDNMSLLTMALKAILFAAVFFIAVAVTARCFAKKVYVYGVPQDHVCNPRVLYKKRRKVKNPLYNPDNNPNVEDQYIYIYL
jgi:Trypsin